MNKGILIVASGPSGVGKGTVHSKIREKLPTLSYSVSVTTRKPRLGEIEGVDYFFVNLQKFQEMIENNELLEYAQVFDNFYGTPRAYVEELLNSGRDVLLEIDVQGALQIKKLMPDALLIFIAPPSMKELEKRLRGRATDEPDVILRRLMDAAGELSQQKKYDYVLVNDDVERCAGQYLEIIAKEKEKRNEHN